MVSVDLDADEYFALADLEAYTLATLQQAGSERPGNPYADDEVARPLAARIAELSERNFLVAYLTALKHGLRDEKPAAPEELAYTPGVRSALQGFLSQIPEVTGIPGSAGELLTALAYAEAPGLSLDLWITAIEALYEVRPGKRELRKFIQSSAANFLVQSGPNPEAAVPSSGRQARKDPDRVFRLFHQALNDTLLAERSWDAAEDQQALTSHFRSYGQNGGWASAPPYLLRSLSHHAERAGMLDELLADDEYLLHADLQRLTPLATQASTKAGKERARLLQLTPYAVPAGPQSRRALFSVTEALEKLGDHFRADPGPAPYRARWSTASTHAERAAQQGHSGGVGMVHPLVLDGKIRLVSGGDDEIVRIWDPASGRQLKTLEGHAGEVYDLHEFTADGGRVLLASAGTDAMVRIWDPATGQQQRMLGGHVGTVTAVCSFTAEGGGRDLLASAGTDAMVRIWDPATGHQQRMLGGHAGTVNSVCSFTGEDDRTLLASSGEDGKILVWDPASGELRRPSNVPPRLKTTTPTRSCGCARSRARTGGPG